MPIPRTISHPRRAAIIAAMLAIVATTTLAAHLGIRPGVHDGALSWTETSWTMPLDNWGPGRVWRAGRPGGSDILLFARTKTGFCNCFNGVADDAEIDRIGDVDLHGDNFVPAAAGQPTSIGDLPGRKRSFEINNRWSGGRHVLSIVAATDCKAVVATLVSDQPVTPAVEQSAIALLTGEAFRHWAANQ